MQASAIGDDGLQAGKNLGPTLGVAFAHTRAIGRGLGDDLFERGRAALALVAIEQRDSGAMPDLNQLAGKTEGVVHAAVHAHATRGTVKVGRVTGQKHPARAIAGGDALVNAIGAPLQHRIGLVARHDGLQRRL